MKDVLSDNETWMGFVNRIEAMNVIYVAGLPPSGINYFMFMPSIPKSEPKPQRKVYHIKYTVQAVNINSTLSGFRSIDSGVPQGSILGLLLFIILVNTLPESVNTSCKCVMHNTSFKFIWFKHSAERSWP